MARRINSIGLCIIVVLCILLIFASNRISFPSFSSPPNDYTIIKYRHYDFPQSNYNNLMPGSSENRRNYFNKKYYFNKHRKKTYGGQFGLNAETDTTNSAYINTSVRIEDVINTQRQRIISEMKDFEYRKEASSSKALIPELGGTPIQSGNYRKLDFFLKFIIRYWHCLCFLISQLYYRHGDQDRPSLEIY